MVPLSQAHPDQNYCQFRATGDNRHWKIIFKIFRERPSREEDKTTFGWVAQLMNYSRTGKEEREKEREETNYDKYIGILGRVAINTSTKFPKQR